MIIEFDFTNEDFEQIRQLVHKVSGIALSDHKQQMVYSRLVKRLRQLNIDRFADYCQLLKNPTNNELSYFINALTTNKTHFFREKHHFDFLASQVIPEQKHVRKLRIWSAGCSTGEEPYSMAICCKEIVGEHRWDLKILATDLDSDVLAKAQQGVYPLSELSELTLPQLRHWFLKGMGEQQGKAKISPAIQQIISFKQLNLTKRWPLKGPFDVIFCRNVVIYFDEETRQKLFQRFFKILSPGGYLMIGHSESLGECKNYFNHLGKTIYQKPVHATT